MKRNVANQEVTRVLLDVNGDPVITGTTTVYVRKDTTNVGSIGTATYSAASLTWYINTGVAGNTDGERITFTWDNSFAVRVQDVYVTDFPQTGDTYSEVGIAGAGLTALGDTRITNLDVAVSTRNSVVPDAAGTAAGLHAVTDALVAPAAIRADLGLASANLDTQLADLPTVAEMNARTIVAANYATAAILKEVNQALNGAKVVIDRDAGTCKIYDTNGTDLLFTITRATVGNIDTLTRS